MIKIKAKQICRWSDAAEERVISGGPMPLRQQSRRPMTSPALRLAVAMLTLLFLVAVGANAAVQAAPDHFVAQSSVDFGFPDCPTSEPGHCQSQSPTYGTVDTNLTSSPLEPTEGSSVWSDAAAALNTTSTHLRLFRPPKLLRAQA